MTQLDATIVNVALPRIGITYGAGMQSLQWIVNAYTLTLAGLLLISGSLGDRLGRRRIFLVGTIWFALASAGCALAPTVGMLIAMRALQGVGGALLTPGSLAILQAVFARDDRSAAVGAWSGLGGIAVAIGPVLGGALTQIAPWTWRLGLPCSTCRWRGWSSGSCSATCPRAGTRPPPGESTCRERSSQPWDWAG